jgi:hypothetical protein
MNLWSFEVVTSLFDDKFLEKQLFFVFFAFLTKIIKYQQMLSFVTNPTADL